MANQNYKITKNTGIMDHIYKNDYTTNLRIQKYLPEEYQRARKMWTSMRGFTPIEKILSMIVFGQLIKKTTQLADVHVPSISELFGFSKTESNERNPHVAYDSQPFFVIDDTNKSIKTSDLMNQFNELLK